MFLLVFNCCKGIWGIKNSAHPVPMLSSVLDNQKQVVTVVQNFYQSRLVRKCRLQGNRSCLTLQFPQLGVSLPTEKMETAVIPITWQSPKLIKSVGQLHDYPSPWWPGYYWWRDQIFFWEREAGWDDLSLCFCPFVLPYSFLCAIREYLWMVLTSCDGQCFPVNLLKQGWTNSNPLSMISYD